VGTFYPFDKQLHIFPLTCLSNAIPLILGFFFCYLISVSFIFIVVREILNLPSQLDRYCSKLFFLLQYYMHIMVKFYIIPRFNINFFFILGGNIKGLSIMFYFNIFLNKNILKNKYYHNIKPYINSIDTAGSL
jgi:hypothetical protein